MENVSHNPNFFSVMSIQSKRKRMFSEEKAASKKSSTVVKYRPGPRVELKFHDTVRVGGTTVIFNAGNNYCPCVPLNEVPQGADRAARVGREIFIKNLTIRAEVACAGTDQFPQRYRCIVFEDHEVPTGLVVTNLVEAVYKIKSAGLVDMNTVRDMTDPARFRVLYNQLSENLVPPSAVNPNFPSKYTWEINLFPKLQTAFSSTTAIINKNALFIVFVGDNVVSGTHNPQFTFQSRVMFSDQ